MNHITRCSLIALTGAMLLVTASCDHEVAAPVDDLMNDPTYTPVAADRVAIPASVRSNLGVSFVKVERRRIEQTLRVPGRFEYLPTARREYRTMLPGRVELLVEQFAHVEVGQPLYRINAPEWRAMQQQLADAESSIIRSTARQASYDPLLAAHQTHESSLVESISVWTDRITQLESVRNAGGGRMEDLASARSSLATARAELASVQEKKAEIDASRAETQANLEAASARLNYLIDAASTITGVARADLIAICETDHGPVPCWATITTIDVSATESGVVEELRLTNGAWADQKSAVLTIVKPDRLRFRASGLQSDLGVLRDGLTAHIVPPTPTATGRAVPIQSTMTGTLSLGLSGDVNDRTIDVYVVPESLQSWARPGVTAQLEIITDSTATAEMAIPLSAVQRDGLISVIFRRAPDNPNEAIRIEADLGKNDGRWVALLSGVRDGDEIVLDGAFQLMLSMSDTIQKSGHFHSDGTFHDKEH